MDNIKIYHTKPIEVKMGRFAIKLAILKSKKLLYYNSDVYNLMLNENYNDMMFYKFDNNKSSILTYEVIFPESFNFKIIDLINEKSYMLNLNDFKNKYLYDIVIYDFEILGLEIVKKYNFIEKELVQNKFNNCFINYLKWKPAPAPR
jgi:hypothetical protein